MTTGGRSQRISPARIMRQTLAKSRSFVTMGYVSFIMLVMLAQMCQCQTICSTDQAFCKATFASSDVVDVLSCGGMGKRTQFPSVCTDTKTISHLLIEAGNTTIESLQGSAFNGLRIGELTLTGLGIRSVNRDTFNGLAPYIQTLHMDQNLISELPVGLFNSLSRLRHLDLQNNLITIIRDGCFDPLTSLAYLNLASNAIATVEPKSFIAQTQLVQLLLQNNTIEILANETFKNLAALEDLSLAVNEITVVSDVIFSGLRSLRNINLTNNNIALVPNGIFRTSSNLESVDLSQNSISNLGRTSVSELPRLKTLLLYDNFITDIPPYQFAGLPAMETLSLFGNNISKIESNSFSGMPYLFTLDMSRNSVNRLPQGLFDPLGALLSLDFSYNSIDTIDSNPFEAPKQMTFVSLAGNRIKNITKDMFQYTTKLKSLRLGDNQIKSIDPEAFDFQVALEELDLGENLLTSQSLDGRLRGCDKVQILRLSGNPLGLVTDSMFASMRDLTTLYLDQCCLEQISFKSPLRINEVQLQRNFLSTISTNTFAGLVELVKLDLSSNGIEVIEPGSMFALKSVKSLNLRHNLLTTPDVTVPDNIDPAQRDYHLLIPQSAAPGATVDLSWNKITNLEGLQQYAGIYLAGNPIECSCAKPTWLAANQNSFVDRDVTTCVDQSDSSIHSAVCYSSNQIKCPSLENNATISTTPTPFCPGNVTRILNYAAILAEEARLRSMDQVNCYGVPTQAPGEGPRIFFLAVSAHQWTVTARWNVTDIIEDIQGYTITFTSKSSASADEKNANKQIQVGNETFDTTVDLQYGGRYSVCVSVVLPGTDQSGNVTNAADISPRCDEIILYPEQCDDTTVTWPQCANRQSKPDITKWLIIGIVIGGSLLILLLILIIVCLVLRKRRIDKKRKAAEQKEKDVGNGFDVASMSKVTGKEYYDTMAEQSTLSVQDFVLY